MAVSGVVVGMAAAGGVPWGVAAVTGRRVRGGGVRGVRGGRRRRGRLGCLVGGRGAGFGGDVAVRGQINSRKFQS